MDKAFVVFVMTLLVFGGGMFLVKNGSATGKSISGGEVQKVVIGMKNFDYYPQKIKVKAGIPVSVSLDKSVFGCFRDFTIRELGISEYLANPSDSVEFTIDKKGTYTFECSMGMGSGILIAE